MKQIIYSLLIIIGLSFISIPTTLNAQEANTIKIKSALSNNVLEAKTGKGIVFLYVNEIYRWGTGIVGPICVLIIIINGLRISSSAGNTEAITQAKGMIAQSISGLVLLFMAGTILYIVNPNAFVLF